MRAMVLTIASHVAFAFGEYEEAERSFRAALQCWRDVGNPRGRVWCITSCTRTLMALGKHQEAQHLLRESLALSHTTDDRGGVVTSTSHLGLVVFHQGDAEASLSFFREALSLLGSTRDLHYLQILNYLGAALWQGGEEEEAKRAFAEVLATAIQIQCHSEALRAMVGIATHHSQDGDHAMVLKLTTRVLADPRSDDEARHGAVRLQRVAHAHLPADEVARIEQRAHVQPLAEVLAELGVP